MDISCYVNDNHATIHRTTEVRDRVRNAGAGDRELSLGKGNSIVTRGWGLEQEGQEGDSGGNSATDS